MRKTIMATDLTYLNDVDVPQSLKKISDLYDSKQEVSCMDKLETSEGVQ